MFNFKIFISLQKLILSIIKMADSINLNEKDSKVIANAQEANVDTVNNEKNVTNDSKENNEGANPSTEQANASATSSNESLEKEAKNVLPLNPRDDDMKLVYLDKDFVYDCMSVPTYSKREYRMVTFIILWARRNGINYEFDDFGNVYLTKGKLDEGEFYPCVTSHLDTVQDKQEPYIYAGVPLDLKTERTKEGFHKISVDANGGSPIGIGADDKGGICICLSMFKHLRKLKACFFLDEETGCHGSDNLDKDWFKDVGYVIGYDSPDLYRAAWSCSGVKLFSYEFYNNHMKEVCDRWGLTKGCFFSEPYTDVKNIREKTDIICMNFGNGGYYAHSTTEYSVIEDMDQACGMGVDLIDHIGCTEHKLKHVSWANRANESYKRNTNGTYELVGADDTALLQELGDNKRKSYYGGYSSTSHTSTSGTTTTTRTVTTKEDELKFDTVKYIVNRYDSHILGIKDDIIEAVKALCEKSNIAFDEFEKAINEKFNNTIKF